MVKGNDYTAADEQNLIHQFKQKMGQMDLLRFLEKYYGWWSTYHIRLKLGWSNGRINANLNRLLKRGCVERDSAFMEINGSIRKGVIWRYKKC